MRRQFSSEVIGLVLALVAGSVTSVEANVVARPLDGTLCASLASAVNNGDAPTLLTSYPNRGSGGVSVPPELSQTAFVYDNALVAIALVSCGDLTHAVPIANALSLASRSDRKFHDGRLRNAYRAGAIGDPPLMPGWWDEKSQRWLEDPAQDGTSTGNVAWAALALLTLHQVTGNKGYLADAERLMEWVAGLAVGRAGYSGGFHGFDDAQQRLDWESTEHNVDVYSAAHWLNRITQKPGYSHMAARAQNFVASAFRSGDPHFDLGTTAGGDRANPRALALDVQLWPWMAITDSPLKWRQALHYAEAHLKVGNGFDFNDDKDGVWVEGTAQAALAYKIMGNVTASDQLLDGLKSDISPSGLLNATRSTKLSTGLSVDPTRTAGDLFYFRRPHIGATAWAILAAKGWNPFTGRPVR